MQSPDKRRALGLRHGTKRRGLCLEHAVDPCSGELFTLFGQRHALAPQIRAARPREIALGLQLFQRGVDRLLRLDQKFADLRLRELPFLRPQRI